MPLYIDHNHQVLREPACTGHIIISICKIIKIPTKIMSLAISVKDNHSMFFAYCAALHDTQKPSHPPGRCQGLKSSFNMDIDGMHPFINIVIQFVVCCCVLGALQQTITTTFYKICIAG